MRHGTWPHEDRTISKAAPHKPKGAASASKSERPDVAPPAAPAQRVIARLEDLKQLSAPAAAGRGGRAGRMSVFCVQVLPLRPTLCYKLVIDTITCTTLARLHMREQYRVPAPTYAATHGMWPHKKRSLTNPRDQKVQSASSTTEAKRPGVAPPAASPQRVIARPEHLKQLSASVDGS